MNFIETYDDALPSENCDKLIEYFNNNPHIEGKVGDHIVDPNQKKSTELNETLFSLHTLPFQWIYPTLQKYTDKYIEKIRLYRYGGDSSEFLHLADIEMPTLPVDSDGNKYFPTYTGINSITSGFSRKYETSPYYIFKTFNLTAYVKYTGEIYVETLDTFYNAGSTINIPDFTNTNDVSIDRALPFKSIKFEFPESKTYLTKQRNEIIGGTAFGSLSYQAEQDLDGGEYTIKSGFEKLLYEKMTNVTGGANTQLGWGWMVDFKDDIESVDSIVTNPLMFFNVNGSCSANPISWTTDAHASLNATYNRPSNVNNAQTITLNFGAEIDEFNLTQNNNSLYEKYYKTYISRLFNKRTRIYKYKAKFNSSLIQRMELNATVQIFDRLYLINNMSINLVTGDATLELINK